MSDAKVAPRLFEEALKEEVAKVFVETGMTPRQLHQWALGADTKCGEVISQRDELLAAAKETLFALPCSRNEMAISKRSWEKLRSAIAKIEGEA